MPHIPHKDLLLIFLDHCITFSYIIGFHILRDTLFVHMNFLYLSGIFYMLPTKAGKVVKQSVQIYLQYFDSHFIAMYRMTKHLTKTDF